MSPEPLSQKAWRARNRDRINERQRKYRKTNQRTYSEKGYEQGALKRRGLTMADYMTMAIKQNNLCAICKQSEVVLNKDGLPKRLAV